MTGAAFGLAKNQVRRSFAAAAASYDSVAALQREIGERLLLMHLPEDFGGTVVDGGCGTGFLTEHLTSHPGVRRLIAVDMALPMLQVARAKVTRIAEQCCPVFYLGADMECLPLQDGSVDWLLSNLAVQWSRNLAGLFDELQRVLKAQGRLVFSTFGPHTLHELKSAWAQVDAYPHVNEFYCRHTLSSVLRQTGFEHIEIATWAKVCRYASPLALMRELKGLGAHNVVQGRKRAVTTPKQLQQVTAVYESLHEHGPIPATFEVFYVTAVKS
jgi:malonyl-CoA O-methyltransferase